MPPYTSCLVVLLLGGILWGCALGLQRPPPRYSQQFMPDTSFSCRHKIVGSYYADPETDCQLFHVCVSVAGSIQDYRFLCPNDTAFDQESQTCADWYDVDCEAATLYYASDNFDLYRIGSGLESVHYDSIRSDAEPLDHFQRSESSDAIRSSTNSLTRVAPNSRDDKTNHNNNNNNDILRGSSSNNFYNNENNGKEDDYENEKVYREENSQESRRKVGMRKVARKQQYNVNNNNVNNLASSTTSAPAPNREISKNYKNNGNYFNGNNNVNNERQNIVATPTNTRPVTKPENFSRSPSNQRTNGPSSTYQPILNQQESYKGQQKSENTYQGSSLTAKPTDLKKVNTYDNSNQQNFVNNFKQSPITTARTTDFNNFGSSNNRRVNNQRTPTKQYNQNTSSQPTTVQPSTSYQSGDFTNFQEKNYNDIQRATSLVAFQPTTAASTFYDVYNTVNNKNNNYNDKFNSKDIISTTRELIPQTTPKYFTNNFAGSSYIPTTFSPTSVKFNNNNAAQSNSRGNGQYENDQYYEKFTKQQPTQASKSTQYYDTAKSTSYKNGQYFDATRAPKKAMQYNNDDGTNSGKYLEGSTRSYDKFDLDRTSVTGFSPASINHLAETARTTTQIPRRSPTSSAYNPSTFIASTSRSLQTQTTVRGTSFVSASPKPFSTMASFISGDADASTKKPKLAKKNDYDYAYYDNTGAFEYDGLDLGHNSGTKDSSKITRN